MATRLQQLEDALAAARARAVDAVRQQRPWAEVHAASEAFLRLKRELAEATRADAVLEGRLIPQQESHPQFEAMMKAVQPLVAAGFRLARAIPDDLEVFGNAMLELIATDLVVRLVIDRSRMEVVLAPAQSPEDRVDFSLVLDQIGAKAAGAWSNFDDPVAAILRHRNELPAAIEAARQAVLRSVEELMRKRKQDPANG